MDPKNWLLDKRVLRRNLKRGVLEIEDFDKEMKGLPDLESQSEELDLEPKDQAEETADAGDVDTSEA